MLYIAFVYNFFCRFFCSLTMKIFFPKKRRKKDKSYSNTCAREILSSAETQENVVDKFNCKLSPNSSTRL